MESTDSGLQPLSISRGYDAIAEDYALRIGSELAGKPQDREWLSELVNRVGISAPILDLGCGPGHVGAFLADQDARVIALDISSEMTKLANAAHPQMAACCADMTRIPLKSRSIGGIAAFYSLIHLSDDRIVMALSECLRVVKLGGSMLAAFHLGAEPIHRHEMWGTPVNLTFRFFTTEQVTSMFRSAGWTIQWIVEREPIPDVEHPSRRVYVMVTAE